MPLFLGFKQQLLNEIGGVHNSMKTKIQKNRGFTPLDKKNHRTGFTMIESFVAITILLIAVLGPLTLISRSIAEGVFAKNQLVAFYLASEGIEQVIHKRNILRKTVIPEDANSCGKDSVTYGAAFSNQKRNDACSGDWETDIWIRGAVEGSSQVGTLGLSSCIDGANGCSIDASTGKIFDVGNSPSTCGDLGCIIYSENQDNGLYIHQDDVGPQTIFSRKVTIETLDHSTDPSDIGAQDVEAIIRSTVFWNNKTVPKEFTISSRIFRRGD